MRLDQIDSEVLTVEQLANLLQIGLRQAYELVRRGDVYGVRIGRSLRVPKSAVERYLAGGNENDLESGRLAVVEGGGHGRHQNSA